MCDFSEGLIAWIDGELPEGEAASIEKHVKGCAECRSHLAGYREASETFVAYCEAATTSKTILRPQRDVPAWALAAMGAAAAAALLLALAPNRVMQSPVEGEIPLAGHASAARSQAPAAIHSITSSSPGEASSDDGVRSSAAPVAKRTARNPTSEHTSHRERVLAANTVDYSGERVPASPAAALASEPAIEIAIPSDAIFPVGEVPEGVSFVADVTLGADGTAERLRLQPRMVEFERRATRP